MTCIYNTTKKRNNLVVYTNGTGGGLCCKKGTHIMISGYTIRVWHSIISWATQNGHVSFWWTRSSKKKKLSRLKMVQIQIQIYKHPSHIYTDQMCFEYIHVEYCQSWLLSNEIRMPLTWTYDLLGPRSLGSHQHLPKPRCHLSRQCMKCSPCCPAQYKQNSA